MPALRHSVFGATLSQNAQVLVINDLTFEDPSATQGPVKTSTFRVFVRSIEQNERLRVNGPDTYWTGPLWHVSFTAAPNAPPVALCSYAFVSDDAEFLILLGDGTGALSIWRRRYHPGQPIDGPGPDPGRFVREIPLQELGVVPPAIINDATPQWFAGGHFDLSPGKLTFTNRAGKRFSIDLRSGKIAGSAAAL